VGSGVELGRFKLKPGIEESAMRAAYEAMIARFLSLRPGWLRQHLVKLKDRTFVDLAFAHDQAGAERICASLGEQLGMRQFSSADRAGKHRIRLDRLTQ
jgi:hypothetical protein